MDAALNGNSVTVSTRLQTSHCLGREHQWARESEKTPWTRARRGLILLMLFLMTGTLMLMFYLEVSLPLSFWRTSSVSSNNMTTAVFSVTAEGFVAYPHHYRLILDEPHRCWRESPFLVLMIPVAPHNREARDAIRSTWGKETAVLGHVISHYFLLGQSTEGDASEVLERHLLQESRTHQDILQSDFMDSYNNLTIKTMVMFEWLSSHCPNTSYAMKVDSDMFLNVHNLVDMLAAAPRHLYMTGQVARGAFVIRYRSSKWFMPVSVFPESTYPPYALGLGYVFSMDLPRRMLQASSHVRAVSIEDVYVGLCMRHLGIPLTDPPNSGLFRVTKPYFTYNCYWTSVITTILETSEQLRDVWAIYQTQVQNGC
uniref:Hexosyltransferase n=1 Tax=Scophthalmus maximus TaxID=52904 RepID=A0A8D3EE36_SCOMX